MEIGLVVLNYNDSLTTSRLIREIGDIDSINHICIVDNQSTDNSYNFLKKLESKRIHCILSPKNGGYSSGNNLGVRYLLEHYQVDIIIIANPDVKFDKNFVIKIAEQFELHPEYGILSGIMTYPDGKIVEQPFRQAGTYLEDLLECSAIYRKKKFSKIENRKVRQYVKENINILEVQIVPGSLFAISREAFIDSNGFDEDVFLYCEERIISKRISRVGYKLGILPSIRYKHIHSASISKTISIVNKRKLLYESRVYYHKQYLNTGMIKIMMLKVAMKLSLLELLILEKIKKM